MGTWDKDVARLRVGSGGDLTTSAPPSGSTISRPAQRNASFLYQPTTTGSGLLLLQTSGLLLRRG